jgi:hypothetical protein
LGERAARDVLREWRLREPIAEHISDRHCADARVLTLAMNHKETTKVGSGCARDFMAQASISVVSRESVQVDRLLRSDFSCAQFF